MHYYFYRVIRFQEAHSTGSNSAFWGAFWGAAFAFIFGLITLFITKKWETVIKHKNALVKMEQLLHEHFDGIDIARTHTDNIKGLIANKTLTDYRFSPFNIPSDIPLELQSIFLINKYFEYGRRAARINTNTQAKNHVLTRFEDAMLAGRVIGDESVTYVTNSMTEIKKDLNKMDEEALRLLVLTRFYLRKTKDKMYVIKSSLTRQWDFTISEKEIALETEKITAEGKKSADQESEK